jgi:hypothetical protein
MVASERNPPTGVEAHFVAEGAGTRFELEHRGFEAYGDERGPEVRDSYAGRLASCARPVRGARRGEGISPS